MLVRFTDEFNNNQNNSNNNNRLAWFANVQKSMLILPNKGGDNFLIPHLQSPF